MQHLAYEDRFVHWLFINNCWSLHVQADNLMETSKYQNILFLCFVQLAFESHALQSCG